jgi:hypothetical protein
MARPQVFISSTYYDLKSVREDIGRFLRDFGCDVIRHETGRVPYSKGVSLEASCRKEVEASDIVICIIGGRLGTTSDGGHYSITQTELQAAISTGKQVFIFVDRPVHSEYEFYEKNKHLPGLVLTAASDPKVHEFMREVRELPNGYPTFPFDTSAEIVSILRDQFAGLFQRLLSETSRAETTSLASQLQSSLSSVATLVGELAKEKNASSTVFRAFLDANHPLFAVIATAIRVKFRVYFSTRTELDRLLKDVKGLEPVETALWDEPGVAEWVKFINTSDPKIQTQWVFKMPAEWFDAQGRLIPSEGDAMDRSKVTYQATKVGRTIEEFDNDIPF